MTRENYETCKLVKLIGQVAVYVDTRCPHSHLIKGHLVSSKSTCRQCKECKK